MSRYKCGSLDLTKILKTFKPHELEALFKGPGQKTLNQDQVKKRLTAHLKAGVKFLPMFEGQCPSFSKKIGCQGHKKPQPIPRKMKLIFIDVETTGVKYWRNGIHQLSGCIEIGGEVVEEFDYKVQPNPKCEIEDEALAVAGVTREQVLAYPPMKTIYTQFVELLSKHVSKYDKKDKFWFIGYNSQGFDMPMLRAWFVQNGDNYFGSFFHSVSIDVMVLAAQQLMGHRVEMENFKLNTVARKLGIIVDDTRLHDAMYDIEITRKAYHILTKLKAVKEPEPVFADLITIENSDLPTE